MHKKGMFNLVAGLLFTGIFCLNGGAFGYVPSNGICRVSEVVFIDPSVQKVEEIVSQLPKGAEVVRLSPGVDGVGQISDHLAKKRDLSAIHIISHGNAGHFVLSGKRIDADFLRDHGHRISGWGRSLTENGDILLYACNLAATDEGKAFVERFLNLTGADVAASNDITGGQALNGDWDLEYSRGRITTTALALDPDIRVKLVAKWYGGTGSSGSDWTTAGNWVPNSVPSGSDDILIDTQEGMQNPELSVATTYNSFTIPADTTLNIVSGGAISASGEVTNEGTVSATSGVAISITSTGTNIKLNGTITSESGAVTLTPGGSSGFISLTGNSTVTSTSGTVTFNGAIDGAYSLDVDAGTGSVSFANDVTISELNVTGNGCELPGTIRTSGNAISIGNTDTEISLTVDATIDTTNSGANPAGAGVTLGGTVDGEALDLALNAGTGGTILVAGAIGGTARLNQLTVTNSNGTTFTGDVTTGTEVTLSNTTSGEDITFSGNLETDRLTTMAAGYNVNLHGGCTITDTSITHFINTGTVALGNNAGDTLTFDGGIKTTGSSTNPSATTLNGSIETSGAPVALGNTTVAAGSGTGISTVNPAGDHLSFFGPVTINSGAKLEAGYTENTGLIEFDTVDGPGDLEINTTGSVTLGGNIGTTTSPLGVLTLTEGDLTAGNMDIKAGTIAVNGGKFGQDNSPSGAWDVGDVTIESDAIMNATSGDFNVSGDWTNHGTFNHKDETVTLNGADQTLFGSTTFYNLIKIVASAATLKFESATTTTVTNELTLKGASEALLSLRSTASDGTKWKIDPDETGPTADRFIDYLNVKDSNNLSNTAIDAVGKNSVSEGNNTNWTFPDPTITTTDVTSVTATTALSGGEDISDGGVVLEEKGVCWNTSTDPTTANSKKVDGSISTDTFSSSITGLTPNTTYYVRAYVTNSDGVTGYGDNKQFTTSSAAPAGTYYVNIASGNDSNAGTAAAPWKTLHHAFAQINGGSGTYVLNVALALGWTYSTSNGEANAQLVLSQSNVTIKGESGSAPIIDGTGASAWTKGLEITGSDVTLVNLYVTGFSDTDEEGIRISGGTGNEIRYCKVYTNNWGIRVNEATNAIVKNCDIYNNSTHGIDIVQSSGTTLANNKIHANPQFGIRAESSPEIARNEIFDNQYGIFLDATNENTVSPTIKNNVIYEVVSNAMSYGIFTRSNNNSVVSPKIIHNTIDGGKLSGISMEKDGTSSSAPIIKYNIITEFGEFGINNGGASPTINYNDVWNNTAGNYNGCTAGANDISSNPMYGSYSLQASSPCIDTIPSSEGDSATLDYPGFKRPRPGKTTKDMGAYEYVADEINNYTLPGGTGVSTDYRIFTVPLNLGTGADMLNAMQAVLGTYDPTHWRGFLYTGTSYREFNSSQFASHTIVSGMGFWIITTYTDNIPFEAKPAPDGVDYVMDLQPGWHLIGLPWTSTQITLSSIKVTDGIYTYAISSPSNNLTQRYLWDYTGVNGYIKRSAVGFRLENDKGYYFKVLGDTPVRLVIPTSDAGGNSAPVDMAPNRTNTSEDNETPPPPPGAAPIPDIKANGQDGPVSVNAGDSVSVSVSLDPGAWSGRNADWWVAAHTPFDPPLDWYTYAYPEGWRYGIRVCAQTPLFEIMTPFNVLNMALPVGHYIFYFAVDGNMDGEADVTWLDFVEVNVE